MTKRQNEETLKNKIFEITKLRWTSQVHEETRTLRVEVRRKALSVGGRDEMCVAYCSAGTTPDHLLIFRAQNSAFPHDPIMTGRVRFFENKLVSKSGGHTFHISLNWVRWGETAFLSRVRNIFSIFQSWACEMLRRSLEQTEDDRKANWYTKRYNIL